MARGVGISRLLTGRLNYVHLLTSSGNRRLVETVSRSASAARRAASVDEDAACRQQVGELADWLESESGRRVGETTEKQVCDE